MFVTLFSMPGLKKTNKMHDKSKVNKKQYEAERG